MLLDANWLNALKLPTKVISGLFMASIILLLLEGTEILDLSIFGGLANPIVILICVVSGALSFTAAVTFVIDLVSAGRKQTLLQQRSSLRKAEQDEEQETRKQKVLERIEHLSKEELSLLAGCLRENSQSFTTWVHSPYAATLGSKGLIYTPGGTHHQDYYPFVVNDFVWQHLLENKDGIIAKDDENTRIEEEKKRNARHRRY
ncbi:super-infection exclusion protein B [Methylobacter sp. BBA5.1]|uniref:super-infection exclusion protein B n=1 Tax=Methylobacter sp. BBA5.1 TaxID=1495064 RepID=UPI0005623BB7|nr:super-infection exclusion protein B [Methylobacter sp. BBA5.1]